MIVLVINAGSSSLKYELLEMNDESVLCKGIVERIGTAGSNLTHKIDGQKFKSKKRVNDHIEALEWIFEEFLNPERRILNSLDEIKAVGHRVLHSGEDFKDSVLINDQVMKKIEKNKVFGPLHMPANIACIKACRKLLKVPMVAVFDTAFHMTMPEKAYMYGIKYEDYKKYHIRKYGFHGTSHKYLATEAARLIKNNKAKIVTCHLGNGGSLAAVVNGKCIDTTMGLTPLEGLMMGTRSGDIDPAVVEFLMKQKGWTIERTLEYLNKECGYLGISGFSSDSRDLWDAALEKEDSEKKERSKLALEMYAYRIAKFIGAYVVAMGGFDCLVFAGGIGENSPETREDILNYLDIFGVDFDKKINVEKNRNFAKLSTKKSKVAVYIIPTDEELVIARDTLRIAKLK